MNHQRFETWLLADEDLPPEETLSFQRHLETCQQCQGMRDAWKGVLDLFEEAPEVEPSPAFVDRWRKRLAQEEALRTTYRYRWQALILLILTGNVLAGLALLLGAVFRSPVQLLLEGIYRLATLLAWAAGVQRLAFPLIQTIVRVVPIGLWVLLALGLAGAAAVWLISMRSLLALPRRT